MSTASLHDRRRLLNEAELAGVPWLAHLSEGERARVQPELRITEAQAGDLVCRIGAPATYWFGVIDGLLKINTVTDDGRGLSPDSRMGVGILSMQERAAELGGWCTVSRGSPGTVVRAEIPVGGVA